MKAEDILKRTEGFINCHLDLLPKDHPQHLILKELSDYISKSSKTHYFCEGCFSLDMKNGYCNEQKKQMEKNETCPKWFDTETWFWECALPNSETWIYEQKYIKPVLNKKCKGCVNYG